MNQKIDWKKYIIVFFITLFLFILGFFISNSINGKKLEQLKSIQDTIAIDILSSEIQFSLMGELSCKGLDDSLLSQELNELARKLEFSESNIDTSSDEIISIRKYYSLLEIKDYLLMKQLSKRCNFKTDFVLYFYSNESDCNDCTRQGYVLTTLRRKYPTLRVYSFDYNLDLPPLQSLISIYKIEEDSLPALVVNEDLHTGFQSVEAIESLISLELLETAEEKKEE